MSSDTAMGPQTVPDTKRDAMRNAVLALIHFKREFNRNLTPSLLAELFVALELDLLPASLTNQQGFDLIGPDGKRYQVKQRALSVLNVDLNNFDFDFAAASGIDRKLAVSRNPLELFFRGVTNAEDRPVMRGGCGQVYRLELYVRHVPVQKGGVRGRKLQCSKSEDGPEFECEVEHTSGFS